MVLNDSPYSASSKITELRRQIRSLERAENTNVGDSFRVSKFRSVLATGIPEIDNTLPLGGLKLGALHEISGSNQDAAAVGFLSVLLARLSAGSSGFILWCQHLGKTGKAVNIYVPGLASLGLEPSRLVLLGASKSKDILWAIREGLSCPSLLAVVGEMGEESVRGIDGRRLQLAAEKSGIICFLLRTTEGNIEQSHSIPKSSAILSYWRICSLPSEHAYNSKITELNQYQFNLEQFRWLVKLCRYRGAVPSKWSLEWHHETRNFSVVSPIYY